MFIFKPLVFIRENILYFVGICLRLGFLRERRYFYNCYFGTDHPIVLIVRNIFRPNRFFMKFMYGQLVRLPSILCLGTSVKKQVSHSVEWQGYFEAMKRDGIVFIPGFFKVEAENLCDRYNVNRNVFPPSDKYNRFNLDLNDPDIFNVVTDPMLLTILSDYYGYQPYLRHLPAINCTHPSSEKDREFKGFNNFWHYDTVNLTTAHILLNDITLTDNCMLYAKGSHRTHRVQLSENDYYYSEEYMRDHFEIVSCVGEKGTLVIFDPNGLHRVDLKMGTFRSHLHLNFTPGNDILSVKPDRHLSFNPHTVTDIRSLTAIQRKCLAYVFPCV